MNSKNQDFENESEISNLKFENLKISNNLSNSNSKIRNFKAYDSSFYVKFETNKIEDAFTWCQERFGHQTLLWKYADKGWESTNNRFTIIF